MFNNENMLNEYCSVRVSVPDRLGSCVGLMNKLIIRDFFAPVFSS